MDKLNEAINQFINEQRLEYPLLSQWDVFNLKLGFARGVQYQIKQDMAETVKRLEAIK